nr:immunoglobulin heavy chain junction region [Mus musculus]MBK4195967.1 immunoglobulin heavy chain junction region [Mus musculus]
CAIGNYYGSSAYW